VFSTAEHTSNVAGYSEFHLTRCADFLL